MELAPRKKLSCITLVSLYLNKYVHNDLIGDLDLFSIPEAIFSSDQAALWKVLSICLSIHLSVCYTFFTMFLSLYHHEVITSDRSDVMQKVKVRGQRWRSQRSKQILPQFGHFWTLTPFLAATKQLYKWYFPSVCPSVRPSVTPFWLCSHQRIIMKFSGVITNDQSKVHAKGQG